MASRFLVSIPHRYDYDQTISAAKNADLYVSIPHRYDYDLDAAPSSQTTNRVSIPHRYDYDAWGEEKLETIAPGFNPTQVRLRLSQRAGFNVLDIPFQSHTGTITTRANTA